MDVPNEVTAWIADKVGKLSWSTVREPREIAHSWELHGGRVRRAGLTVSIDRAARFSLVVIATDVEADFIAGAKNGVMTALMSQGSHPVLACSVTLSKFKVDEVGSSYMAFYMAAHEATLGLLGVGSDNQYNIE